MDEIARPERREQLPGERDDRVEPQRGNQRGDQRDRGVLDELPGAVAARGVPPGGADEAQREPWRDDEGVERG